MFYIDNVWGAAGEDGLGGGVLDDGGGDGLSIKLLDRNIHCQASNVQRAESVARLYTKRTVVVSWWSTFTIL